MVFSIKMRNICTIKTPFSSSSVNTNIMEITFGDRKLILFLKFSLIFYLSRIHIFWVNAFFCAFLKCLQFIRRYALNSNFILIFFHFTQFPTCLNTLDSIEWFILDVYMYVHNNELKASWLSKFICNKRRRKSVEKEDSKLTKCCLLRDTIEEYSFLDENWAWLDLNLLT